MVSTVSGVAYEPSAVYVPSAYVLLLDASSDADAAGVGVVLDSGVAVAVASVVGSVAVSVAAHPASAKAPATPTAATPMRMGRGTAAVRIMGSSFCGASEIPR
jgi:hypothetical protein